VGILDEELALGDRDIEASLSEDYLENTKLRSWGTSPLALTPGVYSEAEADAMMCAYKRYRLRPSVALLPLEELDLPNVQLVDTIRARRTVRSFSEEPLTLNDVSVLLALSAGITGQSGRQLLRAAPSAGALYPIETYLSVRNVTGVEPGLYHFDWPDHALTRLGDAAADAVSRVCCWQPQAAQSAVVVFLAGMVQRTVKKYGDRGLRYVLLDAGHQAENLWLAATAMGLGCMTTGGFFDDEANDLFRLDGLAESMLYVAFIGHPASDDDAASEVAVARHD
jgi:SagB-type dehydrogenase family enzyme